MTLFIDHPQEWHDRRRKAIGASESPIIMSGDANRIEELRLTKLGRIQSKAILGPWDLALRRVTETLQMDWYEHKNGHEVARRGEHIVSPNYPFMAAELDGYVPMLNATIDAKGLNEWLKEPLDWARQHYAWQVVHQMIVANADAGMLSVMHGTKEPQLLTWEYDPFEADTLIGRLEWFWEHVTADRPIEGADVTASPQPAGERPQPTREVDMDGHNEFASFAADWLKNMKPAKTFKAAEAGLKALVESDVKRCYGYGVVISRSKAGALSIKEK